MAMICVLGGICNGCMKCQERTKVFNCDFCHYSIYVSDEYYELDNGYKVHKDCLMDYLKKENIITLKEADKYE